MEPIFSSEDISRQMPAEAKKFQGVDGLLRETLARITEEPAVLDFAETYWTSDVRANFAEANEKLDEILLSLLEGKGVAENVDKLEEIVTLVKLPLEALANKCWTTMVGSVSGLRLRV